MNRDFFRPPRPGRAAVASPRRRARGGCEVFLGRRAVLGPELIRACVRDNVQGARDVEIRSAIERNALPA